MKNGYNFLSLPLFVSAEVQATLLYHRGPDHLICCYLRHDRSFSLSHGKV